jgi:hypothetical protein
LFAGVFEVHGEPTRRPTGDGWQYSLSEVPGLGHLVGRAIIEFKKTFRNAYPEGENHIEKLAISEIKPIEDFPGYGSVLLPYARLREIVRNQVEAWKAALSGVGGVYVIVDTKTGKKYVGGAYGPKGIWGRWENYADAPHGGNNGLIELLAASGEAYAENFQFSILEILDPRVKEDYKSDRENYWKRVLCSYSPLGYNDN